MVDPEHGLLATDEDLQAYLKRMLTPPDPLHFGYGQTLAPNLSARIGGEIQSQVPGGGPPTVTPQVDATLGPLSLSGGLQLQPRTTDDGNPYLKATPTMAAGLRVPLSGDASAEAKFSYTPEQLKMIEMAYRQKLLGGDLDLSLRHTQPYQGTPDTSVGARWSRRF